jgi:hypothetical protein
MRYRNPVLVATLTASLLASFPGTAAADPAPPAPPAGPKTTIDADGTYAVGTDIAPGVYTTAGPVGSGTCFWKRAGNPDGATLDNAITKKPQTVKIDAGDASFKTSGCQPWQLTDNAAPPPGPGPALAGLQLQLFMAQLNARAAASGQVTPPGPAAPAAPAPAAPEPAPGAPAP